MRRLVSAVPICWKLVPSTERRTTNPSTPVQSGCVHVRSTCVMLFCADRALGAADWTTIVFGAQGLAAIGAADAGHLRSLERALGHNNAFVVAGVADALLTLRARDSILELRKALEKLPRGSWGYRRVDEIVSELEALP